MSVPIIQDEQEWLRVLGKGMITLPKKWRDALGIAAGDIVKARREGKRVVIESYRVGEAPYRVYSDDEIDEFLASDALSKQLVKKVKGHQKSLR